MRRREDVLKGHSPWVGLSRRLLACIVSLLLLGCAPGAAATPTPTELPPIPTELAIYVMLTEKYTAPFAVLTIEQMSADEAARIVQALQAVEPPAGFESLHQQAVDAYKQICTGKLLLPGSDSVLRADAYFMIDWGIRQLLDYWEQLAYLQH